MSKNIGILVGSLRKESYNQKVANIVATLFPDNYTVEMIDLAPLTFYNQDRDDKGNPEPSWTTFRNAIKPRDGILFVTPEYNRSVPALLKNAVDVGSRPIGKNVWNKKAAGIISVSSGAIGGFGANHHLRQSLTFVNMPVVQQPEIYISNAGSLLDEKGKFKSAATTDLLQNFVNIFIELIKRQAL